MSENVCFQFVIITKPQTGRGSGLAMDFWSRTDRLLYTGKEC